MGETKQFHPEQISSMILEKLKNIASQHIGYEVRKAVITVPAYFNDSQRQATKDAAVIAGLDCMRIINEPTAAAIAYGIDQSQTERNVLVYDLGGGTLDVSVLRMDNGIFIVKSTSGDTHLGGEDLDNRLKDYAFMRFCESHIVAVNGIADSDKLQHMLATNDTVAQLYRSPKLMRRLKTAAEEAKKTLSQTLQTTITYDNFYQSHDLDVKISRGKFEELCGREFERCFEPVDRALKDAGLEPSDIHDVVLVGGSTRIPAIQSMLGSRFPDRIRATVNPDEAVAYGAAINAAIIGKTGDSVTDSLVLIDITPLTLGLETIGGLMEPMIPRNTPIPYEAHQTFTTHQDNQPSVTIKVYEGERQLTRHCNLLGKFELTGLPMMPKGKPRVEVCFTVDANGILRISAKETHSNISKTIAIQNDKGRLSDQAIKQMITDADTYKENDKQIRDTIDAKNGLEKYLAKARNCAGSERLRASVSDSQLGDLVRVINDITEWLDEVDTMDPVNTHSIMARDYEVQTKLLASQLLPLLELAESSPIELIATVPTVATVSTMVATLPQNT
jgi:L1 cell adhesion molecule like protein